MYASYWQLRGIPFHNIENKIWFAQTPLHEEAFSRLLFLVEGQKSFGLLSGPEGTGKSTILHQLQESLSRKQKQVVWLDLARLGSHELIWHLNSALGLAPSDSDSSLHLWQRLEDHLHGLRCSNQQAIFLLDHFDAGPQDAPRALRRLQHLQTSMSGWLTIIAAVGKGRNVSQYLSLMDMADIRFRLNPLDQRQTALYIRLLLHHAGSHQEIFNKESLELIYLFSGGVPREINRVCDFALLKGMEEQSRMIDADIVSSVSEDLRMDFDDTGDEADILLPVPAKAG